MNLDSYLPVLLFILVGIGVGIAPQVLGYILGPNRPDAAKNSPYECGFEAFENARMQFDVRYYIVRCTRCKKTYLFRVNSDSVWKAKSFTVLMPSR